MYVKTLHYDMVVNINIQNNNKGRKKIYKIYITYRNKVFLCVNHWYILSVKLYKQSRLNVIFIV